MSPVGSIPSRFRQAFPGEAPANHPAFPFVMEMLIGSPGSFLQRWLEYRQPQYFWR